jgi:hypothetical protein
MSCYFNRQVDTKGLVNLKLLPEDIEDARFISRCFGKETKYVDNGLSILYTSILGSVESEYAMQTFPAGLNEDVFMQSAAHVLELNPFLGEREEEYYTRVLDYKIKLKGDISEETRQEILTRGRRLAEKFCKGKNRIYIIPVENILENKASFGDVIGLRNSNLTEEELNQKLSTLKSLKDLLISNSIDLNTESDYRNPNLIDENGVAIYGPIKSKGITYIEVDRLYEKIQKDALKLGYNLGEEIPTNGWSIVDNKIK